ncbi:MAG: ABC transporter ATP-binding protein [Syntrophorhabdales bacterium]
MSILSVRHLTKAFGALRALSDVTFDVAEGEVLGIIGPNGAGKTTLFNVVVGMYGPDAGDILFKGKSIKHLLPHQICRLGITKTSQIVQPFLTLTVRENVMVALMFGQNLGKKESQAKADEILEFLDITDVKDLPSTAISLPKRKRVELARALGTGAKIILMDENMAGLNPKELEEGMEIIRRLKRRGKVLVVVEHVMQAIMGVCERLIVLSYGEKIAEGTPTVVCNNERVVEAYLGRRVCSP